MSPSKASTKRSHLTAYWPPICQLLLGLSLVPSALVSGSSFTWWLSGANVGVAAMAYVAIRAEVSR